VTLGKRWRGSFALISVLWLAQACATAIHNRPSPNAPPHSLQRNRASKDIFLALNLSGGGTRAAALAYGVFEELADTRIRVGGAERQLLDEVDLISSVSGGSFLAAWHGLHGMETIPSFAESFLYEDFQTPLLLRALSPQTGAADAVRSPRATTTDTCSTGRRSAIFARMARASF